MDTHTIYLYWSGFSLKDQKIDLEPRKVYAGEGRSRSEKIFFYVDKFLENSSMK